MTSVLSNTTEFITRKEKHFAEESAVLQKRADALSAEMEAFKWERIKSLYTEKATITKQQFAVFGDNSSAPILSIVYLESDGIVFYTKLKEPQTGYSITYLNMSTMEKTERKSITIEDIRYYRGSLLGKRPLPKGAIVPPSARFQKLAIPMDSIIEIIFEERE